MTTGGRGASAAREPYVWLLVLFPALSVVGGVVMLVLAVATFDGLVVDDYYHQGKVINRVLDRDRAAAARALRAQIAFTDQALEARLDGDSAMPERLALMLIYATRAGLDREVVMVRTGDGRYRAPLTPLRAGRWHLQLQAADWRLTGSIRVPGTATVQLTPAWTEGGR